MDATRTWLDGLLALLFTLWAGAQWTAGYLVAPLLFARLDRVTAGDIAGTLFQWVGWLGLAVGLILLLRGWRQGGWRRWAWSLIVLIAVLALFVLQPSMAALKAAGLEDPAMAARFGRLHGLSSVLYLVQSLLAAALAFAGIQPRSTGLFSEGR